MKLSDKAKESLDKVIAAFKDGGLSPITEVIKIRRHPNDVMPAAKWSLANQIMAYVQARELDCRGFRQWQEVGRKVRKGARAVYILAPNTAKVEDKKSGDERVIVTGFRTIAVFPLHMTEGDDLPPFDYAPAQLPPLWEVAERLNLTISYGATDQFTGGWYSPKRQHIHLGVHDAPVFFHELAHAAHDKLEGVKGGQDAHQETVAEFSAAVLSELYGHPHTGNAWQYIKSYAPNDPLTAIYKALSMVEKVLALILDDAPLATELSLAA